MLRPQRNAFRQFLDLSGFWDFRFDGDDGWRPIAVPASWNDQFAEGRDHLGPATYRTTFDLPWGFEGRRLSLRFGSVNYLCEVSVNGRRVGSHKGGHLPFDVDVTAAVRAEGNVLEVGVDGALAPDRVPPGGVPFDPRDTNPLDSFPRTSFDFFPWSGIHRPVVLHATPHDGISDITVVTRLDGGSGAIELTVQGGGRHALTLTGDGSEVTTTGPVIEVPRARPWSPIDPFLYKLTVETDGDRYSLPVGIRTVQVEGDALLLNGEPVILRGFGRHEDFPVVGRGLLPPLVVKDFDLMRWVGANSFRTTHYPYSEEMLDLADRLGFLVIAETPAVGLFFSGDGLSRRLDLCRQYVDESIGRDKNRPSVIMWSLANEPHSRRDEAVPFFRDLYDRAKSLDHTRPVTLVSALGEAEESFSFLDVVCLNRYYGWYSQPGRLDAATERLDAELQSVHAKFGKPVLMTEFGADAMAGVHAQPPEMFSEEYQAEMLMRYIDVLDRTPFVVGQHVWNLCDFKTAQGIVRVGGLNLKGVFTRDRRPKLAAHRLRERWHART